MKKQQQQQKIRQSVRLRQEINVSTIEWIEWIEWMRERAKDRESTHMSAYDFNFISTESIGFIMIAFTSAYLPHIESI